MIDRLEIQRQMRELDDSSLRCLVVLKQSDYFPEAVEIAREELARRGLSVLTPAEYWQQYKDEWLENIGFCYHCWSETFDESAGQTVTVNFIGQILLGDEHQCDLCGSVIQGKWLFIIVPLMEIGKYRVIRGDHGTYIGRKLKPEAMEKYKESHFVERYGDKLPEQPRAPSRSPASLLIRLSAFVVIIVIVMVALMRCQ